MLLRLTLLGVVLASACSSDAPNPSRTPLTAECNACLGGTVDAGEHCGAEFQACGVETTCEEYVLCQLANRCYAEVADGSCERTVGCVVPEAAEELTRAATFEDCARTTCASACGFIHADVKRQRG